MKLFKILLLLLTITVTVKAQDSTSTPSLKHSAGLVAGLTTGIGIGYRYVSDFNLGAQINYGPMKLDNELRQIIGFTLLYELIKSKNSSFYLYQSNSLWHTKKGKEYNSYYGQEIGPIETTTLNHGIGAGMEFVYSDRLAWHFMFGYGAYDNFELVFLSLETALLFKF